MTPKLPRPDRLVQVNHDCLYAPAGLLNPFVSTFLARSEQTIFSSTNKRHGEYEGGKKGSILKDSRGHIEQMQHWNFWVPI